MSATESVHVYLCGHNLCDDKIIFAAYIYHNVTSKNNELQPGAMYVVLHGAQGYSHYNSIYIQ